jgi:hypothetical protein
MNRTQGLYFLDYYGKVREFKVIWKTHGKVREISKKAVFSRFSGKLQISILILKKILCAKILNKSHIDFLFQIFL